MSTLTKSKPFDKRRIYSKVGEIEVYYRRQVEFHEMFKVSCSDDAANYFRDQWGKRKIDHVEQFMVIYLNRSNRIMGWSRISLGGQSGTVVDPKIIFQIALKANAANIIMAHNHPSGNVKPSDQDLELTKKIVKAGKFLELRLLDHLILTSETYFSFANESLID